MPPAHESAPAGASTDEPARDAAWAWGTAILDLECDGDLDIGVLNGFLTHGDQMEPQMRSFLDKIASK